jgi:hypothetical protein
MTFTPEASELGRQGETAALVLPSSLLCDSEVCCTLMYTACKCAIRLLLRLSQSASGLRDRTDALRRFVPMGCSHGSGAPIATPTLLERAARDSGTRSWRHTAKSSSPMSYAYIMPAWPGAGQHALGVATSAAALAPGGSQTIAMDIAVLETCGQ